MPRPFWKGAISFGMVVIPVKMYTATETVGLNFRVLHKKCLTRPNQVWHCPVDNEYFDAKETVRGYEYAKEQFVVLEDSDFQKAPVKTAHSIDIVGFVEAGEVDTVYYRGSHYLEPEELGVKPFVLLREALLKTGRVGIAKVTFQRREHLTCLRAFEDILLLNTLHYFDEILPRSELAPPKREIGPEELDMATSLVNAMARKFKPEEYQDEYRVALQKVIEAKMSGQEIQAPEAPKAEIVDLTSALRASIEAAKKESEAKGKGREHVA